MPFIRFNTDAEGYVANWVELPDVENAQLYDGPLPDGFREGNSRFCRMVDGVMTLDEALMEATREKEAQRQAMIEEITTLEAWLVEFDKKIAEAERKKLLGQDPGDMTALIAEAIEKQTRLDELREGVV